MKRLLIILGLFFSCIATVYPQHQFTSIEMKFKPSMAFDFFTGDSSSIYQDMYQKGAAYQLGFFVRHNYSQRFSVSTGIIGLKQKLKVKRVAYDNLGEFIGKFNEEQLYEYLVIPLIFTCHLKEFGRINPYLSIASDRQIIIRYVEKYKDLPNEAFPELKNKIVKEFNELKDAGNTIFNMELGFSAGCSIQIKEHCYAVFEPNYTIALKQLKEIHKNKLFLNKLGCYMGIGYRF